jgi:hypothetical protein
MVKEHAIIVSSKTKTRCKFKMARNDNDLENLVRQLVSHPRFQDAVNSTSNNENATSTTSGELIASSSQNVNSNRPTQRTGRTPREEFQALFNRGASLQQSPNIPRFQPRTNWTPSPSTRTQSKNQGKRNPFCKANNIKSKTKPQKSTFSREVVLLRHPSDGLV